MSQVEAKQDNRLQDLIDWDNIMPMSRYAGGHDDQMCGLFKGATVLAHWNEGDWQGKVATAVKLEDGRVCCYCDYYGSCSGCDAWENATDEDIRVMCRGLANSAKIFDDIEDMKAWLKRTDLSYEWNRVNLELLKILEQNNE